MNICFFDFNKKKNFNPKSLSFSIQANNIKFPLIFYVALNLFYAIGMILKRSLSVFSKSELGGSLKSRKIISFVLLLIWLTFFAMILLNSLKIINF